MLQLVLWVQWWWLSFILLLLQVELLQLLDNVDTAVTDVDIDADAEDKAEDSALRFPLSLSSLLLPRQDNEVSMSLSLSTLPRLPVHEDGIVPFRFNRIN